MYTKIIHNINESDTLSSEILRFRAKITAKKLRSMGISDTDIYSALDDISAIPKDARGL